VKNKDGAGAIYQSNFIIIIPQDKLKKKSPIEKKITVNNSFAKI
jgi:hypothetical protein